ncbi:MAG TPA: 3-isopropylmalate dehydratase [Candidatus Edwardsbacteria bacterium]|nr:3-isopropylmalate dehydratase [Candidatus Edwardsbacteria bacterium]
MAKAVLKLGDDISTDIIYPGRYMATVLPTETPQFAFIDNAEFNKKLKAKEVPAGSWIVAGKNFGCGSSREQAASCLTGWGLKVIAKNFARIFLQNSINVGLYMVICPAIEADEGDELEVVNGKVKNITKGKEFDTVPLPKARQAIIDAGGLIPYTRALITGGRK